MIKFLFCLINKDWAKNGKKLSRNCPQGYRVHSPEGICPNLTSNGGGFAGKSILIRVAND
jgi:hypothetical protein